MSTQSVPADTSKLSNPVRVILEQVEKRRQKIAARVDTLEALIDAVSRTDEDDFTDSDQRLS